MRCLILTLLMMVSACSPQAAERAAPLAAQNAAVHPTSGLAVAPLTITAEGRQPHTVRVELARTGAEQQRGLMFRTNIPADGGMIFTPYPAEGGGPREASFWMKNTPSSLDIIFIRPDGTIARIAENTVPYSEEPVKSGEPVSAVLEINAGKAAELGIAPGDKVSWPGQGR